MSAPLTAAESAEWDARLTALRERLGDSLQSVRDAVAAVEVEPSVANLTAFQSATKSGLDRIEQVGAGLPSDVYWSDVERLALGQRVVSDYVFLVADEVARVQGVIAV